MLKPTRLLIALFFLTIAPYSHADDVIIGKVVGVADGDTITVLENLKQYKIRLFGIDTPESRQDFGNKAKQMTSDLVFGKEVQVVEMDIDKYGRIVGMVYVGNVCVNETLVQKGLAWVYRKYCIISVCDTWLELESQAREGKIGLWSHPNPIPPWEFRWKKRSPNLSQIFSMLLN